IRAGRVLETIELLDRVVRETRTPTPRLAVCALNPHAGEGGKFGREEIDDIAPAIALARSRGIDVAGPFPCDTLFSRAAGGDFDGVVGRLAEARRHERVVLGDAGGKVGVDRGELALQVRRG
ncbi:4-hydroxythreonine-4-phosphate dehydrogenase PdxA, partial [Mycobacterium tuberculosis]|nr:4-hydroxythreonine-4-phosphate dehydrogenase PdxA [Mycobacterium tuberculosis]